MAFTAKLYNCADDPRALNKTLGTGYEVSNIRPTESCDILNPTFILDYDADYAECNYVVVGAPFSRSYFITDMKIDIGKKIVISCAVDVLGTYKEEIEKLECNVVRQEEKIKALLPDPKYCYTNDNDVINVNINQAGGGNWQANFFGNQSPNGRYICLCVAGGDNTHGGEIEGFTEITSQPADWTMRYMFYWVNKGTTASPVMVSIGELISQGEISADPTFASVQQGYGAVYSKDM